MGRGRGPLGIMHSIKTKIRVFFFFFFFFYEAINAVTIVSFCNEMCVKACV